MKTSALLLIIVLAGVCAFVQGAAQETSSKKIGASANWQPPPDFITKAQTLCGRGAGPMSFPECFMNQIAASGAPADAVSFTRMLYGQANGQIGIMSGFKSSGVVDAAQALYPLRANDNYGLLLVNGDPRIIDVDDLQKLDRAAMERDTTFQSLKRKYPQTDLWPGDRSGNDPWPNVQALPGGGTQFIVSYPLINGCHACARVGYVKFAWEFDSAGKLLRTRYVSLAPPPK